MAKRYKPSKYSLKLLLTNTRIYFREIFIIKFVKNIRDIPENSRNILKEQKFISIIDFLSCTSGHFVDIPYMQKTTISGKVIFYVVSGDFTTIETFCWLFKSPGISIHFPLRYLFDLTPKTISFIWIVMKLGKWVIIIS